MIPKSNNQSLVQNLFGTHLNQILITINLMYFSVHVGNLEYVFIVKNAFK